MNATLAALFDGNHSINAHRSAAEIGVYTSCGNLTITGAATTPAIAPAPPPPGWEEGQPLPPTPRLVPEQYANFETSGLAATVGSDLNFIARYTGVAAVPLRERGSRTDELDHPRSGCGWTSASASGAPDAFEGLGARLARASLLNWALELGS